MTTSQDQPPLSRRELRERARARAEEFDDSAEADRVSSGRRARAAEGEGLVEVTNTESVSTVPDIAEAPESDDEASAPVTDSAIAKPFPFAGQVEATSDDEGHTGFQLHDFTPVPDGSTAPDATPEPAEEPSFDALFSDLLEPEADAQPEAAGADAEPESAIPVGAPIEVVEPVAPVAPVEFPQEERTLSRREWRAMRAAAEAAQAAEAAASEAPDTETSDTESSDTEASDTSDTDASKTDASKTDEPQASDVEMVFQEPVAAEPAQQAEAEQPAPQTTPSGSLFIPPLVEPSAAPHSALSDAMAEFEALTRSTENEAAAQAESDDDAPVDIERPAPAFTAPTTPTPAAFAPSEPAKPAAESTPFSFLLNPAASAQPASASPVSASPADADADSYTPPIGHWSRQAELDDENQPFENTLSRDVGGGNVATTTNALVLPMIPQRDDFSSVLNATGEIMVTGTINLPGSVGTTGRDSRHYDDPEVDHLFDAFDNEIPNTDSAPVRAITAVSSHTATRGGIEPGRKQSNRMLNVLLVTASVMAVAVVGLLIAGFVFNIF